MANSTFTKTLSLMAYENNLTPDVADDYTLRVKTQADSLDVSDIAREVANQQGKYQQDEVELLLNKMCEVVADAVASGYIVNLPLVLIQPNASGVVMKSELSQAPNREKIRVSASFTSGKAVRQALASARLELFSQPAPVGPLLNGAVSTRTIASANGTTTRAPLEAGDMCVLTGRNLKLAGTDPSVGILLTSIDTPSKEYFIQPSRVSPNEPKRLQFVLPAAMTEGLWRVKVTTQYMSGGGLTTKPRSYEMDTPLVIGEQTQGGGGSGGGGGELGPDGGIEDNPLA